MGPSGIAADPARLAAAVVHMKEYNKLKADAIDHIREGEKAKGDRST